MKIIFLDVDGVLNSDRTLYEYASLEDDLIQNLKNIVDATNANIVLSSSWRCVPSAMRDLIEKLTEYDLHLSGATPDEVRLKYMLNKGFNPKEKYLDRNRLDPMTGERDDYVWDRGAEIYYWLDHHTNIENFVILDDEDFDIAMYYPDNFVKTSFAVGLTKTDAEKAISILNRKEKEND